MAKILCIETSTSVCSVSIAENDQTVFCVEKNEANIHASVLTVFIQEVLKKSKISMREIDAVAVSKGPGSYTGLRIGVSTAKGLCYALNKPLISVNTLQAMAYGLKSTTQQVSKLFCPMLDARRMEVYTALFDSQLNILKPTGAVIIDKDFLKEESKRNAVVLFGNGAEKCRQILSENSNFVFIDHFHPSAGFLSMAAAEKFANNDFEDLAYFEPFYLKDFVSTSKKV